MGKLRFDKPGLLGWIEHLLKAIAIGVAFGSLAIYDPDDRTHVGLRIGEIIILGFLGIISLAWTVQRIFNKELCGIIHIVFLIVAHAILVFVSFKSVDPGAFIFTFALLMILGDFVRLLQLFIDETHKVKWLSRPILIGITSFYILAYFVLIVLQAVLWFNFYDN
jgi:preprotein translocase subunit SecE